MNEKQLFPSEPSVYHINDMAIIRLEGADAIKYLNGQVTCDVTALKPGQQMLGAHCTPKGKVLATFRLLRRETDLLLIYRKELSELQLSELKKYAIFSKVTITDASDQFELRGIAGTGTDEWLSIHTSATANTDLLQITPDRWLLLTPTPNELIFSLPEHSPNEWRGLEILDGLPHLGKMHQAEFIPQALNLQALNGICFTKGCYTGQEIVARAKYRGANNRALFILEGTANKPIDPTAVLQKKINDNWRSSGVILDIWQEKEKLLVSTVLPSDTESDSIFRIENDESSALSIRPLPYSLI